MSEKNDIYGREKRLETLLEKIRENRGSENADNLLGYGKYMLLNGIGVERREKVIRTLYLASQWQEKPFVQMERADLEGIVERIERSKESEWTKHDYEVIIKKFFKWLRKTEEYPPEAKWIKPKNVKNGKLPEDLLTKEEVKSMIDCAQNPRDKAMIAVLYESGCRVGELCNLNIKNITFDEYGCVVLFPRGKTGPRRVRLAFSTPFLATWIDNHPLKDPDSFIIKRNLYSVFCEFCRWMGFPTKSDGVFFREMPMHVRVESYRSGLKGRPPALKGVRYKLELFEKAAKNKNSVNGQSACVGDVDAHVNPVRDILYFFTTSVSSEIQDLVSKRCIETEEVEEGGRIKKVKGTLDIPDIRLVLLDINADAPDATDEGMPSPAENPSSKKNEQAESPSDVGGEPPSDELLTRQSAEAVKYMKSIGLKSDAGELPIDRMLRIAKDCGGG